MAALYYANLSSKLFISIALLNNFINVISEEIFARNIQIIVEIVEKIINGL